MNGIDKISARIKADSDAEIAGIISEADARCAAIKADYDRKAAEESKRITDAGAGEAEKRYESACSALRLEARKEVLAEKQALVDKAFVRAKELLLALPRDKYAVLCARLAAEASQTGEEELVFSASDRKVMGAVVTDAANKLLASKGKKAALRLSDSARAISGGLVLSQGLVETDCSVDTLVDGLRGELAGKVAAVLFG
jgi:V/A-type H+-transporting ATPase subunit E